VQTFELIADDRKRAELLRNALDSYLKKQDWKRNERMAFERFLDSKKKNNTGRAKQN
jgi:metal-responsive CopG/Arc/MetJ family transcriptional regulator